MPGPLRVMLGRMLYSLQARGYAEQEAWPRWPLDLRCEDALAAGRLGDTELAYRGPWPRGVRAVVCLSHDVDAEGGYGNIPLITAIERDHGVKSTYNVVALDRYVRPQDLVELEAEGFEIGMHGTSHDCRLPFMAEDRMEELLRGGLERLSPLTVRGFRAPHLLRTPALFRVLARLFEWDSSSPDTENFGGGASYNGCFLLRPFWRDGLLEIPLIIPMDATLLMLGYKPGQILKVWQDKLEAIKSVGGVAVLNLHPDSHFGGARALREVYAQWLAHCTADTELAVLTLGEVSNWVREQAHESSSRHR